MFELALLRRFRHWAPLTALLAVASLSGSARATTIEKVVAVVGERAIWLSDLRERAKPFVTQIMANAPVGAQRAAALSQVYGTVLERMVDEELELRAANQSNISVSAEEINAAIERVAKANQISVEELMQEVTGSGMTQLQYREEVRRQILDTKMMETRLAGRIRGPSDEEKRAAYDRFVAEERKQLGFRAAWIRLDLGTNPTPARVEEVAAHARAIAAQARTSDFRELAERYSEDPSTKETGGLLPPLKPGKLPPEIDRLLLGMDVGEVSPAIRVGDTFAILKLVERDPSNLPTYEEASLQLEESVYVEKMNRARRTWLDSLRKQTHVDIRW